MDCSGNFVCTYFEYVFSATIFFGYPKDYQSCPIHEMRGTRVREKLTKSYSIMLNELQQVFFTC